MKYIVGFLLAISMLFNAVIFFSLKEYRLNIVKINRDQDYDLGTYLSFYSFTEPKSVNMDTIKTNIAANFPEIEQRYSLMLDTNQSYSLTKKYIFK